MRLLLAVDSITTLEILLNDITARSWPGGTTAHVLSVVEDDEVPLETWREDGYGVTSVRREMRRRGEQLTSLAVDRLRAIGIPAEVTIMRGSPEFLISFTAQQWLADLILIRAHNRKDFRNWMLGSVAKSAVESAPCSVEIVRSTGGTYRIGINRPMRILLATDGSDISLAASRVVADTIWPPDAEVKVVSVVHPVIYSLEEIGILRDKGTNRAHRAIGETINVLKDGPFKISGEVISGRAAQAIIARAKNWQADLIVVGTHQRRGVRRLLLGGTSALVASRAHCSVRVIRGRGSRNEESFTHGSGPSTQNVGWVYRFKENQGWRRVA